MNKQGKVIILAGTPRSGKTTLSLRLSRNGFNRVSFDHLGNALKTAFPAMIPDSHDQDIRSACLFEFFQSLVISAYEDAAHYGVNTVFDVYDFTPEYIRKLPHQEMLDVYFLGYPDNNVHEIEHNIVYYAQPTDWITQVNDEYLKEVAARCYKVNQTLMNQCVQYGYPFINTKSGAERDKILEELYNAVIAK